MKKIIYKKNQFQEYKHKHEQLIKDLEIQKQFIIYYNVLVFNIVDN